jgi:hypothetical protein
MRWIGVLALCACNRIFGTVAVGETDARVFDAPLDAPPQCPPLGTPPRFSSVIHEVIAQNCSGYVASATTNVALAHCSIGNQWGIFGGPIDQPLALVPELPAETSEYILSEPRISPEGDLLLFNTFDLGATLAGYHAYTSSPSGWIAGPDLPLPGFGLMSVPSRGPDHRMIFYDASGGQEWSENPATRTWSMLRSVPLTTGSATHTVWLSADALWLVEYEASHDSTGAHMFYAARATRDEAFGAFIPLTGMPPNADPFITEDCGRVYMASVQAIFYAQAE